jgi:hypothetical protein
MDVLSPPGAYAALAIVSLSFGVSAATLGHFEGDLILKILPDGRNMELEEPFKYVDSHSVEWPVPAHIRVDGASIQVYSGALSARRSRVSTATPP